MVNHAQDPFTICAIVTLSILIPGDVRRKRKSIKLVSTVGPLVSKRAKRIPRSVKNAMELNEDEQLLYETCVSSLSWFFFLFHFFSFFFIIVPLSLFSTDT